jgi:organic hydroperoxide reductase OsmC/OhrA
VRGEHRYDVAVRWTGNLGEGTAGYRSYSRSHVVSTAGRPDIAGTSDPMFRGDTDRWNPEQLLVAAVSQCHMLWYLHLAATAGVVVVDYVDDAVGVMVEGPDGAGEFREVLLRPTVTVTEQRMVERAHAKHGEVGAKCFIARSVNFPIHHDPTVLVAG